MLGASERTERFAQIARRSGALAIVANDQRESLRTLLAAAGRAASDGDVSRFKVDVTRALSPLASAILIDPQFGLRAVESAAARDPGCGLIVAADRLVQEPGEVVVDTSFDESLPLDDYVLAGAAALKLLVIWRRSDDAAARQAMVARFVDRCRELGVLSVVEAVCRVPDPGSTGDETEWQRDRDILAAAAELGSFEPDLYKAEVPSLGTAPPLEIERMSADVTASVPCPWVVLSGGVDAEIFPTAVLAACRGGASGFLAGRGIWGPSISAPDPIRALTEDAATRLSELIAIVDAEARPWQEAAAT
jgi:sulfofructosephosphate aldolase